MLPDKSKRLNTLNLEGYEAALVICTMIALEGENVGLSEGD